MQLPGMIDVIGRFCAEPGCTTHATFGVPGPRENAEYCKAHKKPGMENVVSKRCIHPNSQQVGVVQLHKLVLCPSRSNSVFVLSICTELGDRQHPTYAWRQDPLGAASSASGLYVATHTAHTGGQAQCAGQ